MLKFLLPLALITTLTLYAHAQDVEYGSAGELAGVRKVSVSTSVDVKLRNNIVKEISKKLPSLVFCDSVDDAEVVLQFGSSTETVLAGVTHTTVPGTTVQQSRPNYSALEIATGYVAKFTDTKRLRGSGCRAPNS